MRRQQRAAVISATFAGVLLASGSVVLEQDDSAAAQCQKTCEAAGHCASGLISCDGLPSCGYGCAIAAIPGVTATECEAECVALGKSASGPTRCDPPAFHGLKFSPCEGCAKWGPGQKPPAGDPAPEDCGTPAVSHCVEGCKYARGALPLPFPPPCVPGSFCCPGDDPHFDPTSVKLAGNFGDNMVLQRAPARSAVYGTATPGAHVKVTLTNPATGYRWQSEPAAVRTDGGNETVGTWKALLPAQTAGTGYTITASCADCTTASVTTSVRGVAFGSVWVCSGQSNSECCLA
jgi:hypothetical protein